MTSIPLQQQKKILGVLSVSPLVYRRWQHFLSDRRAVVSLWTVLIIFFISLFADLLANDKPIIGRFEGEWIFPLLQDYPEDQFLDFGFLPKANFSDPEIKEVFERDGNWLLFPLVPHHFHRVQRGLVEGAAPHPPSAIHWIGTDDQERDMLARLIHGLRISFLFGFSYVILSSAIGISVGAAQGYFGGWVDLVLQRILEVYGSIPTLFVLIILAGFLQPNFWLLLGLLVLFGWTSIVGVVRLEFLRGRNLEYVKSAAALGVPDRVIMWRHIFPNAMIGPITMMPFALAGSVTVLSSLDFLGFGLPTDSPSLGEMARQAFNNRHAWWILATVFGGLGGLTILMVYIGEGVRNALDPRRAAVPAPSERIKGDSSTTESKQSAEAAS